MIKNIPILQLKNINFSYKNLEILKNISFTVCQNEVVVVIGPNGGGKTSLAKIIAGLLKCSSGEIIVKKNLKIGYVPQKIKIDQTMPITVKRFLELYSKQYIYITRIEKFINVIGINNLLDKQLYDLSGGQLQKVMLGGALLNNPELLILDEPLQGLDLNGQVEFYELIKNLNKEIQISIFMISHDLQTVMRQADQVICLNKHICCYGTAKDILDNPNFNLIFDNKVFNMIGNYNHKHDI